MAKAMIVLHVGATCRECDLYGEEGTTAYCKRTDYILHEPDRPGRPEWCPARPIPDKVDANKAKDVLHQTAYLGWNACVEFLEGEAYETWPHKSDLVKREREE